MNRTPTARATTCVLTVVAGLLLTLLAGPSPAAAARTGLRAAPGTHRSGAGWRVQSLGHHRYRVSWTSSARLPRTSDRPRLVGKGLRFGPAQIHARTVSSVVTAPREPRPAGLDVVLSGDRLDEPGFDPLRATQGDDARGATSPTAPTVPPTHLLDAPDPALPGPYATVTSDYTLPSVHVNQLPEPVEMVGHVVEPAPDAATGPRPLVLFLHGRHEVCYHPGKPRDYTDDWPCQAPFEEIPSQLGYDYIQKLLASQGYATVSIRVNGINAQDVRLADGGAGARAQIVRAHLDHWAEIAAEHQVDLSQVVLVGHSRGGEGVDRAAIQIPSTAPYRIVGQVLIAPTDFATHTAPYVPTVTLLPYCDGDVYDLQGQKFTDSGRDLTDDDTALKSSVLVMGANHNFFNTEWTPGIAAAPAGDDWGGDPDAPCGRHTDSRLKPRQQQAVGKVYVDGAVRLFTGQDEYLPLFDGEHVTVPSLGSADVRSAAVGAVTQLRRPGIDATPTLATGGARASLCAGATSSDEQDFSVCGRRRTRVITPNWAADGEQIPTRQFLQLAWSHAGATGGLRFTAPLDLSTSPLTLRTIVDPSRGDVRLRVRLGDAEGNQATFVPDDGETLPALLAAPFLTKLWAQSLTVDPSADPSAVGGLDLTRITSVDLVADSRTGRVWVADLGARPTSASGSTATERLPLVELGDLRLPEGDRGRHVAQVPFHVEGDLTTPGRFEVVATGEAEGSVHRRTIELAPGQTSGTIPVAYDSNAVDDRDAVTELAAYPLAGVATDDYLGRLTVVDDDPTPEVTVTTGPRVVREGSAATITVRLSAPSGLDHYVFATVEPGRGTPVSGLDVPTAWLQHHVGDTSHPGRPLYRLYAALSADIPPGRTEATVSVPIARDGRREGRETLTLKIETGRRHAVTERFVVPRSR